MSVLFADRAEAGRRLAGQLMTLQLDRPIVYALPRGGVPVAYEVADALGAPLDLVLVRKIGVPSQPELAAGSIVDGDRPEVIVNRDVVAACGINSETFKAIAERELAEIERRRTLYGAAHAPVPAFGRTVILVDDGVATGASMAAAITAMRRRGAKYIVAAAPVAAPDTARELAQSADRFVSLAIPQRFTSVGRYYEDFHQLGDEEVLDVLAKANARKLGPVETH
jgi:putative phosphoribosyl transferase